MFNKNLIFRQQPQFSYQLRSYAVLNAGFMFNATGPARDAYLAAQNDHSLVFGWGYNNDEGEFFGSASRNNLMGVPADHLQSRRRPRSGTSTIPAQTRHTSITTPTDAGSHYVAFVMSDGDNVQWLTNDFARSTRWFGSPHRGDFDMTFDLSPALAEINPVAMKYLYDQAAADAHRTFFVTAGGKGLNYPSQTPDMDGFMDATVAAMTAVDHNVISVLDDTVDLAALRQDGRTARSAGLDAEDRRRLLRTARRHPLARRQTDRVGEVLAVGRIRLAQRNRRRTERRPDAIRCTTRLRTRSSTSTPGRRAWPTAGWAIR